MSKIKVLDKYFNKIIDSKIIDSKVESLAHKINRDYKDKDPIFVCVLKGSFMFASDLLKKININCKICFIQVSSYIDTATTGSIKKVIGLNQDINDKDIIIIEDIVDTGNTSHYLRNYISDLNARSCVMATLLYKSSVFLQNYNNPPEYFVFDLPNKFIIGYGLDYNQYGRNFPDIYEIE